MAQPYKRKDYQDLVSKFKDLCEKGIEDQQELFLKSMIFSLDDWKEVQVLNKEYKEAIKIKVDGDLDDMNCVQAAAFLQKNGVERTAIQRKHEVADIDLDLNSRICFIEYLLLHYKATILRDYYKRTGEDCKHNLDNGAIGVTGVGYELLDELFTIPTGLDPELERALEELTACKKARSDKLKALAAEASKGGVKGGIAAAKLAQAEQEVDQDELKKEAKINSAMRKGGKQSGDQALRKKQEQEKKAKAEQAKQSKNALQARIANMGLN